MSEYLFPFFITSILIVQRRVLPERISKPNAIKNKESETKSQKQRVRNKTFPLVYYNIKNPWASRCFRCSSSWAIKSKTQPVALIINKLKIMQSIFTFSLTRFHNKQVYGCDQTAKGFFSYCEAYFIVNPILSLNQVINILRAKKI